MKKVIVCQRTGQTDTASTIMLNETLNTLNTLAKYCYLILIGKCRSKICLQVLYCQILFYTVQEKYYSYALLHLAA